MATNSTMGKDAAKAPSAIRLKQRKLYQVRHHAPGATFGKHVGFKGRLLPRYTAQRVATRLRAAGLFITIDPLFVNLTPAQAKALDARYSH